ncbi:MAG: DUF359 domain-containing protein [Hadesarchaea archaeon]|nr:MAG: DUF359 domain-containing protein [Hadesarchaea archaeon]
MEEKPALLLPAKIRARLKRPLGRLFPDVGSVIPLIKKLRPPKFITVGDIVSARFLGAGVKPDVVVVDFSVMRAPAPSSVRAQIESFNVNTIRVKNPAGILTADLQKALMDAEPPVKIVVEGEEDLAVLPAVISSPLGSVVVYGQPGEGLVLVEVTEEKLMEFKDIVKDFKPVNKS